MGNSLFWRTLFNWYINMKTLYRIVNLLLLLLSIFLVYQMYNAIIIVKNTEHLFFYLILLVLCLLCSILIKRKKWILLPPNRLLLFLWVGVPNPQSLVCFDKAFTGLAPYTMLKISNLMFQGNDLLFLMADGFFLRGFQRFYIDMILQLASKPAVLLKTAGRVRQEVPVWMSLYR